MDTLWQQYYWQHYLLQQQQQPTAHTGLASHPYTPTGTYGPMTHAVRTQQAHHSHPYTPSPSPPLSQQTQTHSPATTHEFPPPPPPPLPTTAPPTPTRTSFKNSPTRPAPPVPPATVPFPQPTIQESWHPTDTIGTPTQSTVTNSTAPYNPHSGHVGWAFQAFQHSNWLLAYHGTADFTARTLSHGKYCGLIPTRSIAESVFTTHLLQEIRENRLDLDWTPLLKPYTFHKPATFQTKLHKPEPSTLP